MHLGLDFLADLVEFLDDLPEPVVVEVVVAVEHLYLVKEYDVAVLKLIAFRFQIMGRGQLIINLGVQLDEPPEPEGVDDLEFEEGVELGELVVEEADEELVELLDALGEPVVEVGDVDVVALVEVDGDALLVELVHGFEEDFEEAVVEVGVLPALSEYHSWTY